MKCVKCPGELVAVRVDDVDVDQCGECGGIWFDARELERVLEAERVERLLDRAEARPDDDGRRGRCPRCKGEGYLVQVAHSTASIHVDTCAVCGGKWLDGGELERLRQKGFGATVRRIVEWVLQADLG